MVCVTQRIATENDLQISPLHTADGEPLDFPSQTHFSHTHPLPTPSSILISGKLGLVVDEGGLYRRVKESHNHYGVITHLLTPSYLDSSLPTITSSSYKTPQDLYEFTLMETYLQYVPCPDGVVIVSSKQDPPTFREIQR